MNILCLDVGGTAIKHAMIDSNGDILRQGLEPTLYDKEQFLNTLSDIVSSYEGDYTFSKISLSFPGYINTRTGFAENSGSLQFLKGTNILKQVASKIDTRYDLFIENDANCAALAENYSGNAIDNESFLLVTIGTGFGGAFFINNQIVRGFQYKAGEFGHMRTVSDSDIDLTVNDLTSVRTLIQTYKELKNISDETRVSGEDILDLMDGDKEVKELVYKWVEHICTAIFNVITVINPEKVLVGGGISSHPKLIGLIQKRMDIMEEWMEFKVPIETCKYHNNAGLLGAYYNASERIPSENENKLLV